jgi:hypothetical protein
VGAIGVGVSEPRVRAIARCVGANGSPLFADAMERVNDPVLLASVRVRLALVLGVLFLMVSKVDLVATIEVLLFALAAGLVAAALLWRTGRKAASTV